ncbi:MAG: hypothetical protein ACE37H_14945 [Phycisphaeraceae bacterium]
MNNAPIAIAGLLAQSQEKQKKLIGVELEDVSKHVNDGVQHDLPWELLLVGLGLTLIVIVAVSLRRWWRARQDDPSPLVVYSAVARKAGLGWGDRFLLWRIARAGDLPSPTALLLARGALRHHAKALMIRLGPRSAERVQVRLERIESELFG